LTFPSIDEERLWSDLMTLATIGALPNGGCDRLALTPADVAARNLFAHWCEEAALPVTIDAIGNMFARWDGTDPSLPPVFIGSHLDTQSPGGKFDGPLGVLAALECIRTLRRAGLRARRSIEVVNWTNEEGARFAPGLMGSAVFTGVLDLDAVYATRDKAGHSVAEALAQLHHRDAANRGGRPVDSYLELHIEQGDRLQTAGRTIGVVTGSEFNCFADIECFGANGHAQATPMTQRVNALTAAAELIAAIERIGREHAPAGSAGVAVLDVWPNNRINIPHHTRLTYAATHPERAGMAAIRDEIAAAAKAIAGQTGVRIEVATPPDRDAVDFDPKLATLVAGIADGLGLSTLELRTRAGHDAIRMAPYCPTQMIFVPCKDGISHSEYEDCTPSDAAAGANVLLRAAWQLADRPA
jgi:beta-ureidopropionase / N-carbamoyl-L-amino-acid hydrolase